MEVNENLIGKRYRIGTSRHFETTEWCMIRGHRGAPIIDLSRKVLGAPLTTWTSGPKERPQKKNVSNLQMSSSSEYLPL